MLCVETIGKIRRRRLIHQDSISEIARDLGLSRNTVKKALRSGVCYCNARPVLVFSRNLESKCLTVARHLLRNQRLQAFRQDARIQQTVSDEIHESAEFILREHNWCL